MSSPGWLVRYQRGDRSHVWHELRQIGARVRLTAEGAAEAQEVCDEMARRARQNVELIVERLASEGYEFHSNDDAKTPVSAVGRSDGLVAPIIDWLDAAFDAVPLTLLSWLRIVGDVWLVGTHPDWRDSSSADPFVLEIAGTRYPGESYVDYFRGELEAHEDMAAGGDEVGVFVLPVAPDRLHKANVSGGAPYGLLLPDACAEGVFVAESTMPFVSYLNWVFQNGGFAASAESSAGWDITRRLSRDLLPL